MGNDNKVMACVEQSPFADHIADYGAWAAQRMNSPLELLHVIDRHLERGPGDDHSGAIGIGAQENLLNKLAAGEAARTRAEREQCRVFLNTLRQRAVAAGSPLVDVRQRHGQLEETLAEQEQSVRLLVLGRGGHGAQNGQPTLGGNFERVVRALHKPVLAVTAAFKEPRRIMIAFDGGIVTKRGVTMVAASPLFRDLDIHLLMSGKENQSASRELDWARETLEAAGFRVSVALKPGDAESTIASAVREQSIDMLVMGAFGHSALRSLVLGSKTTDMLRATTIPILLLR